MLTFLPFSHEGVKNPSLDHSRKPGGKERTLLLLLLALYLLFALTPEIWPCKKIIFYPELTLGHMINNPDMIQTGRLVTSGHSAYSHQSLPYIVIVDFLLKVIENKLFCLRAFSILCTILALLYLYLFAFKLFNGWIASLFLLLLITSPIFLEGSRAYGFIPLTNLVVSAICYYTLLSATSRKLVNPLLLVMLSFLTLSLYVVGRLAILFPFAYLGFHLRKGLRNLVVLTVLFLSLVAGLRSVGGENHTDIKQLFSVGVDWYEPPDSRSAMEMIETMGTRIFINIGAATRYILGVDRVPYDNENENSRIINPLYTLFLLAGLFICLLTVRGSPGAVLLLFSIFFIIPMAADHYPPRRIFFSLPPLYLIIAVGIRATHSFLLKNFLRAGFRRFIPASIAVVVSLAMLYDLHEFVFAVSRPYNDLGHEEQQTIARFIEANVDEVDGLTCNKPAKEVIWGNEHFFNSTNGPQIRFKYMDDNRLRDRVQLILARGEKLLYLYSFPARYGVRHDMKRLRDNHKEAVEWADEHYPEPQQSHEIASTGVYYIIFDSGVEL